MDLQQLLAQTAPFSLLHAAQRTNISALFQETVFQPGETIIEQGQKVRNLGITQSGSAIITIRDHEGREYNCGQLFGGDIVFDLNLLSDSPASASVTCSEKMKCYLIRTKDFIQLIQSHTRLKNYFYSKASTGVMMCHDLFCDKHSQIPHLHTLTPKNNGNAFHRKAELYIENNYFRNVSLEMVAKETAMSKYHFCRQFKHYFGMSFKQYLNKKRVMVAKNLIKRKGYTVTDAGFSVGFNDSSYFSKVFKDIEGCSPKQFMESNEITGQPG